MNSIVQEASSIAKAVQQAWEKAGKPQRFSIRVFEESEKNFFGITTKPAKIALLFEKKDIQQPAKVEQKKPVEKPREDKQAYQHQPKQEPQKNQEKWSPKPQVQPEKKEQSTPPEIEKKSKILWTDEMVAMARNWMKDLLVKQNKQMPFTTDVKRYHMKFVFAKPIFEDENKQKNLFRNAAFLIMQSIRNRFKKQFRYHKVIITSGK